MRALFDTNILIDYLNGVEELTGPIADRAVALRRAAKMRIPDVIILATARVENLLLVTRNTKDFAADGPGIRVPYRI